MSNRPPVMARFTPFGDDSRDFDQEFWQAQGPAAIFDAAEEMVRIAVEVKGGDARQLELQRSVGRFRPARRPLPNSARLP